MHGKIKIETVNLKQLEAVFYWPVSKQCTENDQQFILDLFIVWRFLQNSLFDFSDSAQIIQTIASNLDSVMDKWLKIANFCTDEKVRRYSILLFREIIDKIWNSGFHIDTVRNFYPVITKGARNIEETDGLGYMKMIYSQIVVLPTTQEIDGIIRKRPVHYYAVHVHVLSRRLAGVTMIRDFLEVKDQVEEKERVNIF